MTIDGTSYCGDFTTGSLQTETVIVGDAEPPVCEVETVTMTTTSWGNEITWTVGDCSGGPYTNYATFTDDCCLEVGTYTLSCNDSFGDGWHGGSILIGGTSYCGDFSTGSVQTETVVISEGDGDTGGEDDCYVSTISLVTSSWGNEVTWTIDDCSGGPYSSNTAYTIDCCLAAGEHTLQCIDSFGDGWHGATMTIDGTSYCGDFTTGSLQTEEVTIGEGGGDDSCPPDLDGNGSVAFNDLLLVLSNWGESGVTDLDGSGSTAFNDLLLVLSSWG